MWNMKMTPNVLIETPDGVKVYFDSSTLELVEVEESAPPTETSMSYRVVLTEHCNLRCKECFVTKNNAHLRQMSKAVLMDVMRRTIEESRGKTPRYHFFGGEPLLRFDLIREAVRMTEEAFASGDVLKPEYAITTNLTVLSDDIIEFFVDHDFVVGVSLDGPQDIHDGLRPFADGTGSYRIVYENYQKLVEAGVRAHVLITPNREYSDRLIEFVEGILTTFPMETITVNTPFKYDTLEWDLDGPEYAQTLVEIWRVAKKYGVSVDCALTPVLAAISSETRRVTPCSMVGDGFMPSVGPDGEFSYCAQKWEECLKISARPQSCVDTVCESCYARGYCGGVCAAFRSLSGLKRDQNKCGFMKAALPLIVTNLDLFVAD